MYFPPKKDPRYGIVIFGIILLFCICSFIQGNRFLQVLFIFNLAFFAWIWFGTGHTITDNSLEVKCGPYDKKIPFNIINRVKRSNNRWFCASLSFSDLLEVKYRYGVVSISPLDPHQFINELKQRCPEAEFSGL
jgi:hypothetical protein